MEKTLLFIVGRPRSGTKLLRNILNLHPEIHIAEAESHIIPKVVRLFQSAEPDKFQLIEQLVKNSVYYRNVSKRGRHFDFGIDKKGNNSLLEIIYKILCYGDKERLKSHNIIGDKTPHYLSSVKLLSQTFPKAKFIHIIRDPRDQALSAKKVWNQNVLLSAEKWANEVKMACNFFEGNPSSYIEVKYEDLVKNSKPVLASMANFLSIPVDFTMTEAFASDEKYGDAKGNAKIKSDNFNKFKDGLGAKTVRRVEEIAIHQMKKHGYVLSSPTVAPKPIRPLERFLAKMETAASSYLFHIKEKGLIRGLKYILRMKSDRRRYASLLSLGVIFSYFFNA